MINLTSSQPEVSRELQLKKYLDLMDADLSYEVNRRLNGDGVYVGYKVLRDFYKGNQWSYKPEDGQNQRMYNYCYIVVENNTAFLTSEIPDITHEPIDVTDPVEQVVSEEVTKYLRQIHEQNNMHIQFQTGGRIGSMLGDTFILGPFWNAKKKQIFYRVAERPEYVRPIWETDDFTKMAGYVCQYRMDLKRAEMYWSAEMQERGIQTLVRDEGYESSSGDNPTNQAMVTVKEYWDEFENVVIINDKVIDYTKHDWAFVPGLYIPNTHLPGETKGTSDLENILDPQQEYNIASSSEKDILDAVGVPLLWGNELDGMQEIRTARGMVYSLPERATLAAIQPSGNPTVVEGYSTRRKSDITALGRQNDVTISGGGNVAQLSGRAMAVLMQGINNAISLRKPYWKSALETLNENILRLSEIYIPESRQLIRGNYRTSVFISSAYMRNETDELNKLTHKIQSVKTTMKNVGISSPNDEVKLMKTEMEDDVLNIELSRQPGLLRTWRQQDAAAAAPPPPVTGGAPTTLTEGGNQPGDTPAPTPGSGAVATPAGAVAQQGQQTTQAPMISQ